MALIIDPDNLNDSAANDGSTEVYLDAVNKLIYLNPGVGNLAADDGALFKALYSFIKEERINDPLGKGFRGTPPPIIPITDEFYQLINGWNFGNAATRQTLRGAGWQVLDGSGNVTEHWSNITAIGSINATDQLYYDAGVGATDFVFPGAVNEAIQVISDPNGDGSYSGGFNRSSQFEIYNREEGQLFSSSNLEAIGVSDLLAPKAFSFAVGTGTDTNISASDAVISTQAPYTGMSITRYSTAQARNIGGTNYDFGIIIDGNNATKQQIYEFVQWALRQSSDQDAGAGVLAGNVMSQLLRFEGATLRTLSAENSLGGGTGVYIDNFSAVDTNDLAFTDNTETTRTFPFVAAGVLEFNTILQNDPSSAYFMFFADGVTAGLEYGNATAILVNDNSGSPISGNVSGVSPVSFDFDYDGNTQGGRAAGQDANIVVVAMGLGGAQEVVATGTITRSNANSVSLVASIERQYENQA